MVLQPEPRDHIEERLSSLKPGRKKGASRARSPPLSHFPDSAAMGKGVGKGGPFADGPPLMRRIELALGAGLLVVALRSETIAVSTGFLERGFAKTLFGAAPDAATTWGFLRLPFVAAIAFVLYGELPELWVALGATLICAGIYLIVRDANAKKA